MKKILLSIAFILFVFTSSFSQINCENCKDVLVDGTFQELHTDSSYMKDLSSYILNYNYSEFKKTQGTKIGVEFEGVGFNFGDNESQYEQKRKEFIQKSSEKIISSEELSKKWGDQGILDKWSECTKTCSNAGLSISFERNGQIDFSIKLKYTPGPGTIEPTLKNIYLSNVKLITPNPDGQKLTVGTKIIVGQILDKKIGANIILAMENANDYVKYLEPKLPEAPDLTGQWFRTTDQVGKLQVYTINRDEKNPKYFTCNIGFTVPIPNFEQYGKGHFENDSTAVIRIYRKYENCESFWILKWKIKDLDTIMETAVPEDYSHTCVPSLDLTKKICALPFI